WNLVLQSTGAGKKGMLIVPPDLMEQFAAKGAIIGVASSSTEEGFRQYRKKKKYCEWAVYVGDDPEKDMPDLKFVDESGEVKDVKGSGDREKDGDRSGRESSAAPPRNVEVRDTAGSKTGRK
ncbi:MAG: hypothetical protein KAW12_17840, partial [Candidatus Aminicenantes bacterium]|nr:hypothetical protein [Candidatus Aminicenantes bacterium]